ncbi:MAG: hypothetical protein A2X23_03490 [Chloroflexi bacterium GWC2_73_18]|nr:MAG: hypothetical protein A2X23_03490 [Chloroflexi bacterium GWC2_73_18]
MADWQAGLGGGPARTELGLALDRRLARLLVGGMIVSVVLIGVGVALMLVAGEVPLRNPAPRIDLARLPADLAALRPEGFLWLGLLVGLGTPFARVLIAFATYAAGRDRRGALVTAAVAGSLLLSLALALGTR